jgi:hypothetical protein
LTKLHRPCVMCGELTLRSNHSGYCARHQPGRKAPTGAAEFMRMAITRWVVGAPDDKGWKIGMFSSPDGCALMYGGVTYQTGMMYSEGLEIGRFVQSYGDTFYYRSPSKGKEKLLMQIEGMLIRALQDQARGAWTGTFAYKEYDAKIIKVTVPTIEEVADEFGRLWRRYRGPVADRASVPLVGVVERIPV